jgi:hypothetical protein
METAADLVTEFDRKISAVMHQMNVPIEYHSTFRRLFISYLTLSYLDGLFEDFKEALGSSVEGVIESFQRFLTTIRTDQLEAMKELGSSSVEMPVFLKEIDSLKRFCDNHRRLRRSLSP